MGIQKLKEIISGFEASKDKYLKENGGLWATSNEDERAELVSEWAAPVANAILHTGYFQVDDMYRIYPTVLELYYHEESDNGIEDPIMYHTNARCPAYLKEYPYLEFGSFHLHTSGIDITFEKGGEYRASFLIRAFKVTDGNGKTINENDEKSTHLFDYMFPAGVSGASLSKISWESIPGSEPIPGKKMLDGHRNTRKNVFRYEKSPNGRYKTTVTKSGNRYFEKTGDQCTRLWQFVK